MARKSAAYRAAEEAAKNMVPAILVTEKEPCGIPLDQIIIDSAVIGDPTYEITARAVLFMMLKAGRRDFIPVVFPRPDGKYALIRFRAA